jgi:hypothetical protein
MKKLKFSSISILIISMFFLAIIGCAGGSDSGSGAAPKTDSESVAADIAELIDSDIQGANTDLNNITGNLTLPVTGASGTVIAWTSNPTGVIAADGTITRPASTGSDATVILTATITKGTVTETKDFTIIVLKIPADQQAVADDKASLVDTTIIGTNSDLDNVTTNLTLPSSGSSLSDITWAVTSGTGISISGTTGTVTRPSYGSSDATVTITATIQKGSYSDTKTFTIIILAITTNPAQTAVDAERDKLTVASIESFVYGENVLTKAQTLVSAGYTVSIISSSNIAAISTLGAVDANGSSNVVFRVTKDSLTADTSALALTVTATQAPAITGYSVASGTTNGSTTITYTKGASNSLKFVKQAGAFTVPNAGDDGSAIGITYTSGTEITGAVTGEHIGLYEIVTATSQIVKFADITLTAENILIPSTDAGLLSIWVGGIERIKVFDGGGPGEIPSEMFLYSTTDGSSTTFPVDIFLSDSNVAQYATFTMYSDAEFSVAISNYSASASPSYVYIKVTAQDTTTIRYYKMKVEITAPK